MHAEIQRYRSRRTRTTPPYSLLHVVFSLVAVLQMALYSIYYSIASLLLQTITHRRPSTKAFDQGAAWEW